MPRTRLRLALLFALLVLPTPVARAAAGAVEINHARAEAGGVTPGDGSGYPVTLSRPGRYVLTGDLAIPGVNVDGIHVTADHVSIDLAGFSIVGPTVCTASPTGTSCTPTGSGRGIRAGDVGFVEVLGGSVRGAGNTGVELGSFGRAERVTASSNGQVGIATGVGGQVSHSRAIDNGSNGIAVGGSGRAQSCYASGNDVSGIAAANGSAVVDSTGNANRVAGIFTVDALVSGSVASGNDIGIVLQDRGTAIGNVTSGNGQNGIYCPGTGSGTQSCNVIDNRINDNGSWGLRVDNGEVGYRGNVIRGNAGTVGTLGPTPGTAVQTGPNMCDGDTTCPEF